MRRYLWAVFPAIFLLYVAFLGFPVLSVLLFGGVLAMVLAFFGVVSVRAVYSGALALLVACPVALVCDRVAVLAYAPRLLQLALAWHMDKLNLVAQSSANVAYILICAAIAADALRRVFGRIDSREIGA